MKHTGSTAHKEVIIRQERRQEVDRKDVTLAHAIAPFKGLSEVQQRFVVAYAGGKSIVDAYQFANPEVSRDLARKYGSKLLKNSAVAECVSELSSFKEKKIDLSRDAMAKRMMMLIGQIQSGPLTAKHYDVVVKIMDMFNKMAGNYAQADVQVNIVPTTINIIPTPPRSISNNDENIEDATFKELPSSNDDLNNAQQNIQDFLKEE